MNHICNVRTTIDYSLINIGDEPPRAVIENRMSRQIADAILGKIQTESFSDPITNSLVITGRVAIMSVDEYKGLMKELESLRKMILMEVY